MGVLYIAFFLNLDPDLPEAARNHGIVFWLIGLVLGISVVGLIGTTIVWLKQEWEASPTTANVLAAAGSDCQATSGMLIFVPGGTTKCHLPVTDARRCVKVALMPCSIWRASVRHSTGDVTDARSTPPAPRHHLDRRSRRSERRGSDLNRKWGYAYGKPRPESAAPAAGPPPN